MTLIIYFTLHIALGAVLLGYGVVRWVRRRNSGEFA